MTDRVPALTDPPVGYAEWLADLKGRIHAAQQRAALAVNTELRSPSCRGRPPAGREPINHLAAPTPRGLPIEDVAAYLPVEAEEAAKSEVPRPRLLKLIGGEPALTEGVGRRAGRLGGRARREP